jgi:hypothetical protein
MPYEQQTQKPSTQNIPSSNQNQSNPAQQVGNNVKKDEPTAQSGKDNMKNEGSSCSSSDKKSA